MRISALDDDATARRSGYVCELSLADVDGRAGAADRRRRRPGRRPVQQGDRWPRDRTTRPSTSARSPRTRPVDGAAADKAHRVSLHYAQVPARTVTAPSIDSPVSTDDELVKKPIASPFAFDKVGLVTPVYPGMRALLVAQPVADQRRRRRRLAVADGAGEHSAAEQAGRLVARAAHRAGLRRQAARARASTTSPTPAAPASSRRVRCTSWSAVEAARRRHAAYASRPTTRSRSSTAAAPRSPSTADGAAVDHHEPQGDHPRQRPVTLKLDGAVGEGVVMATVADHHGSQLACAHGGTVSAHRRAQRSSPSTASRCSRRPTCRARSVRGCGTVEQQHDQASARR